MRRVGRVGRSRVVALAGVAVLAAGCGSSLGQHTGTVRGRPSSGLPTIASNLNLTALSFVTPKDGYVLGSRCHGSAPTCKTVVMATLDGGQTWKASAPPSAAAGDGPVTTTGGPGVSAVTDITFANRLDGWAWGPSLYATTDAAASWRRIATLGQVLALAVVGKQVWVVEAGCTSQTRRGACPLVLQSAPIGGGAWTSTPGLPPVRATAATLVATSSEEAWLEVAGPSAGGGGSPLILYGTSDAGTTWKLREDPCRFAVPGSGADPMAAVGVATVWLGCAGEPGAGSQAKAIYTSTDAGRTWKLAGSSGPAGAGPPARGTVPLAGYLQQLVVTSPTVAWMALARGTLMVTRDGGRTWEAAIPSALLAGSSGAAAVAFAGPTSGWALAGVVGEPGGSSATDVVFRTVDGGRRWAPVG